MTQDYHILLENLQGRRFDEARREAIMSDSFEECVYSDCIKYCLEAMEEIDPSYAGKALHITKKIQDNISTILFDRGYGVDFRYQGPIQTETQIQLFGGIEMILVQTKDSAKPWEQVKKISAEVMDILVDDGTFKRVDYSDKFHIKIATTKPSCEIDILPAIWSTNKDYEETKREIDRSIVEYNFKKKTQRKYLPFKHIARINSKDAKTNGGLKRLIRLFQTIIKDAQEDSIELNHYEISSLLYAIPEKQLLYNPKTALSLLGVASAQLNRAANDRDFVEKLVSPSERELVFGKKHMKQTEIIKFKNVFDQVMEDVKTALEDLGKNIYSNIDY